MDKLITRKEAASILGISVKTLDAARTDGLISYVQYVENEDSMASSDEFCKNLISGILLHRALAYSLKTRMGRCSIFSARNPARQI